MPWEPTVEENERYRQQRRNELLTEMRRKQRSSCKFCAFIGLVPLILLLIRIFAPITEDINADSCRAQGKNLLSFQAYPGQNLTMECAPEKAHFINAFTSRCLCTTMNIGTPFNETNRTAISHSVH